jgi:hypothetical protein
VLDVTLQIPSTIPFLNLSFLYSEVHFTKALSSNISEITISTRAGSISSDTASLIAKQITVETSAGSITGHYTLGESLYLRTAAGFIDIDVDVDDNVKFRNGTLATHTDAGSIQVQLSPLKHRDRIRGIHSSNAGAIRLEYPGDWEGIVEGETRAGAVMMRGEGIRIVESRGQFAERYVRAEKGDQVETKSYVTVFDKAGAIDFSVN